MKPSHVFLAVSLVANVALVAAWIFVPSGESPSSAIGTASVAASASKAAVVSTPSAGEGVTAAKPWSRLGTEDLASLISRLRAAGFPASVLRAIVMQRFELRREELTHDDLDQPYWKKPVNTPPDPKLAAELAQLDRERTDTLKQLFGPDDSSDGESDEARVMRSRQFGNLSAEKISEVEAIQVSYGERFQQLYGTARGGVPIDGAKVASLNQQQHAEIAKVLTPDELLEYDMRNSPTSSRLRTSLTGLNPTEAEYRALFPIYQAFDTQFSPAYGSVPPQEMAARATAQQQMEEQIKSLLSPDRYADYLQASNPQYQQLNGLVTRLDLPLSAAAQVVAVQQDIQQRAGAVRVDPNLSSADRIAQSAALAEEATTKITGLIGARGLEGYKQYAGQWLQRLQPAPRANSKSP